MSSFETKCLRFFMKWINAIILLLVYGFLLLAFSLEIGFQNSVIRASYLVGWLFCLHYTNKPFAKKYLMQKDYAKYITYALLLVFLVSILRMVIEYYLLPVDTKPIFIREQPFRPLFHFFSSLSALLLSALFWYSKFLSDYKKTMLQIQKQQIETKLNLLQAQVQPHFLFNTLNNIYSLIIDHKEVAADAVLQLSEMLRYAVYNKNENLEVSVSIEAKQIETLIWLFQLKSDKPYNITFEKDINGGKILPMLLITFVENALKYCDFATNPNAKIEIKLKSNATKIDFEITNSFSPKNGNKEQSGVGLKNVRERLQLYYSDNYSLEINEQARIFLVKLEIYG